MKGNPDGVGFEVALMDSRLRGNDELIGLRI
jgi:hypothetical protein